MMDSLRPLLTKTRSQKRMLYKDDATMSSSAKTWGHHSGHSSSRSLLSSSSARSLMSSLSDLDEDVCLSKLNSFCSDENQVSSALIFRFAIFHNFDCEDAMEAIEKSADNKYLHLRMQGDLAEQFESRLLFPLSRRLKTKQHNSRVIYVRPARYQHSPENNEDLMVESLCYVLNDCSRTEAACRDGVAVVINMKGWSTENFSQDEWSRFMKTLQGELVPTKVKMVLIAEAPKDFVAIWNVLRKSLLTRFSKNVHMIKEKNLGGFFMEGYEEYMPSSLCGTWLDANEICEDYIDLREYRDK
mmetsp:Transcript_12378/g.29460  ORF Transcript_12378/g.29460 Transcript_12378/m.29460 type:complete len:300 (+) Transcript_12378:114-1013(+)